jgi:hypothetical protein
MEKVQAGVLPLNYSRSLGRVNNTQNPANQPGIPSDAFSKVIQIIIPHEPICKECYLRDTLGPTRTLDQTLPRRG